MEQGRPDVSAVEEWRQLDKEVPSEPRHQPDFAYLAMDEAGISSGHRVYRQILAVITHWESSPSPLPKTYCNLTGNRELSA